MAILGLVIVAVVIVLAVRACDDGSPPQPRPPHKATCWKPSYAKAPDVEWAKDPSATHRHGAGPRGSNVCG